MCVCVCIKGTIKVNVYLTCMYVPLLCMCALKWVKNLH